MPMPDPATQHRPPIHHFVRSSYLLRIGSMGLGFASMAFHSLDQGRGMVFWGLLILQFLVYPHLLFWYARSAHSPRQAELNNLRADALLLGMWIAALKFPLWIAFAGFMAITMANTISQGVRGMAHAVPIFVGGMLLAATLFGFHASPETGWLATWIPLVGVTLFVMALAHIAYLRNQQLRSTREALRLGEQTLTRQLAENKLLHAQLQDQAIRDPLTGLYNRRYLDSIIARELARCRREETALSLMMIDVDHFKKINDTYGHPGGDELLKKLAGLLLEEVRASDVACRWGGEEFLVLLPGMACDVARMRADKWRASFANMMVPLGALQMQATLSIGVAVYPDHGESLLELTRCADLALYRAKEEGRNRVLTYHPAIDAMKA